MSPQEYYTKEERKQNGVFYTPTFLSNYLAKKVIHYSQEKSKINFVIDPACGDGSLLRGFLNALNETSLKGMPKVLGVDKDLNAIISSKAIFSEKPFKSYNSTFCHTDGLFPVNGKSSIAGWQELKENLKTAKGFDIALSNPPWGADMSNYPLGQLASNFTLAKGQFDIFDLFFEAILNTLNDNGVFGLILPDAIFSHEQAAFRSMLAKSTTILLIARLGEKIFPEINRACVIIIGKKAKAPITHHVDCFRLTSSFKKQIVANELLLEEVEKELSHQVLQSRFYTNNNFVFDIDLKSEEQRTFDKILQNSVTIKKFVVNTRGAEISKKGIVCQCPKCNFWMPHPKSKNPKCNNCNEPLNIDLIPKDNIILNHNGAGNIKLKVGEDLYRFTSVSKSWINTLKQGINYKDFNIYNGDKILVRKTGVGITASIDYENSITNQVVYILKLRPSYAEKLTLEFILAILNSRAMTYFLLKKYGENEWKSHPYLTQTMLVDLPFPNLDFSSKETCQLINRITKIIRKEVSNSSEKNISKKNDLYIERVVAHLFKLNKSDYRSIFHALSSADQLIPIRRLLNCTTQDIFAINGV